MPIDLTPIRRNRLILIALWFLLYCSYTLFTPPLLDGDDSMNAEVAREMVMRHDWLTPHVDGIRYMEQPPLLYWAMAASMAAFAPTAAASRLPLSLSMLALVFLVQMFASRAFASDDDSERGLRAGFYAGLLLLSSFGVFIFSRINRPETMLCLWLTLAMYCFWLSERPVAPIRSAPFLPPRMPLPSKWPCYGFAACCGLGMLTTGLSGLLLPLGIVAVHLALTRGVRGGVARLLRLHPVTSAAIFFLIAAPWHVMVRMANPPQVALTPIAISHRHWSMLGVVSLLLFWVLVLVWTMPWSAFLFKALGQIEARAALAASPLLVRWRWLQQRINPDAQTASLTPRENTMLLLGVWAVVPIVYFSFSARQEYLALPALPALVLLIAAWLDREAAEAEAFQVPDSLTTAGQRIAIVILVIGAAVVLAAIFFILYTAPPGPIFDLTTVLRHSPTRYDAMFGYVLELTTRSMGSFHDPLTLTAIAVFCSTLASWLLRRNYRPHAANCWLASGAVGFLLAAHTALQIFAPVLSSKQLADAISPELKKNDIVVIHGQYEAASTLGFYLRRDDIHILDGRGSKLEGGSLFPDAPPVFEDAVSIRRLWAGVQRVFLWQDRSQPRPALPGKVYVLTESGGKEIISNQPNSY